MKKLIAILMAAVMILAAGCSKGTDKDTEPTKEPAAATATPTPVPTKSPTPTPGPEPTAVPEPPAEPAEEPQPTDEPTSELTGNYSDFIGTWYCNSGEIEGWEWQAADEDEIIYVSFNDDYSVSRVREIPDSESEILYGTCTFARTEYGSRVSVDFAETEDGYAYSFSDDGTLIEDIDITYEDGTQTGASLFYGDTAWWWEEGLVYGEKREIPDVLKDLVEEAGAGRWIVAITCPDEELSKACTELGWPLIDETDNEWVSCPWNNPQELILVNSGYRKVEIEVHEPAEGYDPKNEENGWEPGPFMYGATLEPGELCRFVVDLPDNKADATMCLYMTFDEDENPYYLRVFKYDPEDPYISFEY
ncbi:MAG: hypothetical protein J6X17_09075 [Lachnospiraceae bacterium]|nr:hypothetical protein [Lachnospiraceae bacterium]